jgi:phosphomannomutase
VEFQDGWLLVRKSVTEEGLTLRAEAGNIEALNSIMKMAENWLPEAREAVREYIKSIANQERR